MDYCSLVQESTRQLIASLTFSPSICSILLNLMYCLGNYYLVKWDEDEDSVSVVPKCSCSGGSNEGDTVSFHMSNITTQE